jgi:hypothetical protein
MEDVYRATWARYLSKNYTKSQLIWMFQSACEELNQLESEEE